MSNTSSTFATNPMFAALGDEQRKAMTAAFDAMAKWRHDMTSMSEKNSTAVFDKMSTAAKAVGWPAEFVDMTRQQMLSATKMQSQVIEQVMGLWEKQASQSDAKFEMPSFPGMPSFGSMPSFPGMPTFPGAPSFGGGSSNGSFPGMPDMSAMGSMPMVPLQIWMQAAEMWQKSWQQALSSWMDTQKTMMNTTGSSSKSGSGR